MQTATPLVSGATCACTAFERQKCRPGVGLIDADCPRARAASPAQVTTPQPAIHIHGPVGIPSIVDAVADEIKGENYRVRTPARFIKHNLHDDAYARIKEDIAGLLGVHQDLVDYVYFACAKGAEEHTDQLDPAVFTHRTVIVPVLLPAGKTILHADGDRVVLKHGIAYEINHERPHSVTVEDAISGCVVIMASVKRTPADGAAA
jgi:hypothetical protein